MSEYAHLPPVQDGRMASIRHYRKVPAKRGMTVEVDGDLGRITSARNGYIYVRFGGRRFSVPCHPTWRVRYYDADGWLILDTEQRKGNQR